MMARTVSAFIAGPAYTVPPNMTLLILQLTTWDRRNLTATFTISASGYSESIQADAGGRAVLMVPSGTTYTVTLTHAGTYLNDQSQLVVANSEEIAWVDFDLMEPAVQVFENQTASVWVSDATYEDYPYKCAIALSGVVATDVPEVVFNVAEATSGDYAPVAECYDGGIYIWSSVDTQITVPTIIIKHTA